MRPTSRSIGTREKDLTPIELITPIPQKVRARESSSRQREVMQAEAARDATIPDSRFPLRRPSFSA